MTIGASANPLAHRCPQCGSTRLSESLVKSALWHSGRLVLVDGIPAVVCADCSERFYDDATATALDLMHGAGFPAERAVAHVSVPVFSFARRVPIDLVGIAEGDA